MDSTDCDTKAESSLSESHAATAAASFRRVSKCAYDEMFFLPYDDRPKSYI